MPIFADHVVIEVTRRCNMVCNHCLRGKAQMKDIPSEFVDSLLDQLSYISQITFTGGEPTLAVDRIRYIFEGIKKRGITLGCFYVKTNAKKIPMEFVILCLEIYAYCEDKEECRVIASQDEFHECTKNFQDLGIISALSFFEVEEKCYYTGRKGQFINEGLYKENYGDGREIKVSEMSVEYEDNEYRITEHELYMNCEGKILTDCDLSYKSQNEKAFCHVDDLSDRLFDLVGDLIEQD
jgi:hypothetical protein